jgi:hypothetical protein
MHRNLSAEEWDTTSDQWWRMKRYTSSFWASTAGRSCPRWCRLQQYTNYIKFSTSWVRLPTLPHFLRSSGSGTASTQPREDNRGATWLKSSGSGLENRDQRSWGRIAQTTRHPSTALTSPTSGSRSVGIVRLRIKTVRFVLLNYVVRNFFPSWWQFSCTGRRCLTRNSRNSVSLWR